MNAQPSLLLALALVSFGALLGLSACDDETCTLTCPAGQVCVNDDGLESCQDLCGGALCGAGEECVEGRCTQQETCSPACGLGTHCVGGACIEDYTSQNVCDPLRACRRACATRGSGLSACLAACDADASETCLTCQAVRADCEASNACPEGNVGPYTDCCADEFCDCFPSHPACGNVLPCAECAEECGGDAGCFNDCVQAEPACSSCLQPFFTCQGEGGDCTEQFCACTPDEGC